MYTFIEYPKCSTCRKAKSELDGLQCEFQSQNIVTETPTSKELQDWMAASGLPIKSFFNTSGMKYRELGLKDKVDQLTVKEAADLLAWLRAGKAFQTASSGVWRLPPSTSCSK